MKTLDEILQYESGPNCSGCDYRDLERLTAFFPEDELAPHGFKMTGGETHEQKELSEANILAELQSDLEFAIEKAENERGVSAALMWDVISMWLWVLDDDMMVGEHYYGYGLNVLLMVRTKYAEKFAEADDGDARKRGDYEPT